MVVLFEEVDLFGKGIYLDVIVDLGFGCFVLWMKLVGWLFVYVCVFLGVCMVL